MIYPTFDSLLQCHRQRQVSDQIKDNRYADFLMGNCRGHLTRLQGALKLGQTVILSLSGGIFLRYPSRCEQASSSQAKTWIQSTGRKGWLGCWSESNAGPQAGCRSRLRLLSHRTSPSTGFCLFCFVHLFVSWNAYHPLF